MIKGYLPEIPPLHERNKIVSVKIIIITTHQGLSVRTPPLQERKEIMGKNNPILLIKGYQPKLPLLQQKMATVSVKITIITIDQGLSVSKPPLQKRKEKVSSGRNPSSFLSYPLPHCHGVLCTALKAFMDQSCKYNRNYH